MGEAFLLTPEAFVLTVELLCLQSVEVLLRRTFPLQAIRKAPTISKEAPSVSIKLKSTTVSTKARL